MRDRNRRATYAGGTVTAVAMAVLFVGPQLVPVGEINRSVYELTGWVWTGNPVLQLRVFGGVPGGIVAGYLAKDRLDNDDWATSFRCGAFAGGLGLALLYVVYVLARVGYAVIVSWSVPAFYLVFVFPLIVGLPLLPAGLFFGGFAGLLGNGPSVFGD